MHITHYTTRPFQHRDNIVYISSSAHHCNFSSPQVNSSSSVSANPAHPMVHPEGVSTAATTTMMQLHCAPGPAQLRPQLYTTSNHDSSGHAHVAVRVVGKGRQATKHTCVCRHDGLHTCTCSCTHTVGSGQDGKVGKGKWQ